MSLFRKNMFSYKQAKGKARLGALRTNHGTLQTPFFMPDATRASVRGVSGTDMQTSGVEALVVNTYHLMLQPGSSYIRDVLGVHAFMGWDRPILSDSGGYQVYSLIHKNPDLGRITEKGAEFRSVLDGSKHTLTPERAIEIQFDLGVDMMVCLDDPRPNDASEKDLSDAVSRTFRFAERCRKEYDRQLSIRGIEDEDRPLLFGVIQGGPIADLRKEAVAGLTAFGFDGYGFGGRHIDSDGVFLEEVLKAAVEGIPPSAPRFGLGIGTPHDIVRCFEQGWDMFDCVIPTREGRHGRLFVWNHEGVGGENLAEGNFYATLNIQNERYKNDMTRVEEACDCTLCANHTRAYLRHLFRIGDPLALRLATIHNLRFYARLIAVLRSMSE